MMRRAFAVGCLSASLLADHAFADPADCAAIDAANAKLDRISYHITMVGTGGAVGAWRTEGVVTGGFRYIQAKGHWFKEPYQPDERRLANTPAATCTATGSEAVGTEVAAIYSVHTANKETTSDERYWISASRGLPLRGSITMSGPKVSGHVIEIRYDYENIHPPS